LSKPAASRAWVGAFCMVPIIAVIAVASFVLFGARHHTAGNTAGSIAEVRSASAGSAASQPATITPAARGRIQANYAALPLAFEKNAGQTDSRVKYMARGNGYVLFLTPNEAVFSLHSRSARNAKNPARNAQKDSTAVVRMQLTGGSSMAKVSASDELPGKSSYYLGNDPGKWRADVPHYARVSYQDVYPGVNLAFHGAQRQTEFDFVVAPEANPAPIGFHFTGARRIKTDDSGNLVISSAAGDVLLHKPVAYQEQNGTRQVVDARFVLQAGKQVSFELGNYDRSRELVIDPSVSYAYSTYLGGSGNDEGQGIAFDSSGDAYVTGQTASANFPGASNALNDVASAFVTKLAANGSSLVYSVYIGGTGSGNDSGNTIAVDGSGDAFVAGGTSSSNFPHTTGAFQTTLKGAGNAFVLELGSSGALTYSTYLGGSGTDVAFGIALASDGSGDVYVVGKTSSSDFPTHNPLQPLVTGSTESGFLTKLNSSGTALAFSTYIGGSAGDLAGAVAVDSSNNVYVTGQTFSSTFFTTTGAYQTTCGSCSNGNSNAFVTVINQAGSSYVYSTFLGGSTKDAGNGIAVDSADNAYVTGATTSSDFPTSGGALQTSYGGAADAFVTKLNPAGSALVYSTYLGGSAFDAGASIALDSNNNAYITGQTASPNFPTGSPTQSALNGGNNTTSTDAFVSELNSAGSQLVFSTYLGGSADEDDGGNYGAIAVDSTGASIYVTGNTQSTNFPTETPNQGSNGGLADTFVVTYTQSIAPSFTLSATPLSPSSVSPGGSATSTVTVTPNNGFSSTATVTLTCSVSGPAGAASPPTCAAASATAAAPGTLTVNTTGSTALLQHPANGRSHGMFYAVFLPIGGIALLGLGSAAPRRKRLFGFLLLGLLLSSLLLLPACGGSSSGGGGGNSGTTAGTYTITVSGGSGQTGANPTLTLTVN